MTDAKPTQEDRERAARLCPVFLSAGWHHYSGYKCHEDIAHEFAAARVSAHARGQQDERRACWEIGRDNATESGCGCAEDIAARGPMSSSSPDSSLDTSKAGA